MAELHLHNASTRPYDFTFRYAGKYFITTVPAGEAAKVETPGVDLTSGQLEDIVAMHRRYGLVPAGTPHRPTWSGLTYSIRSRDGEGDGPEDEPDPEPAPFSRETLEPIREPDEPVEQRADDLVTSQFVVTQTFERLDHDPLAAFVPPLPIKRGRGRPRKV